MSACILWMFVHVRTCVFVRTRVCMGVACQPVCARARALVYPFLRSNDTSFLYLLCVARICSRASLA